MWLEEDKALLDYYLRMTMQHAAILVATVLGLLFVLAIVSYTSSWASRTGLTVAFAALAGFGVYEIDRCKHYREMAKKKAALFGARDRPAQGDVYPFLHEEAELLFLVLMVWLMGFVWIGFFF